MPTALALHAASPRLAPTSNRPGNPTSRRSVRANTASLTADHRLLTSSGDTMAWPVGPSCPWPQPAAPARQVSEAPIWTRISAALGFEAETQQPRQAESRLPEEVEAMALFTDAPEALPNQGWAGLWRYQGFK